MGESLQSRGMRLLDVDPELHRSLSSPLTRTRAECDERDIRRETAWVSMRDGVRLATDLYLPPRLPAPTLLMRGPYGRANPKMLGTLVALTARGYAVASQDSRGTGDSEPDHWDYYVYETEDGLDFVDWVLRQSWCDGFIGAFGSSYVAQTQWCMALHPHMSAIVPEVSGLGVVVRGARKYMLYNAYARSVGKGANKIEVSYEELERRMLPETLAGGFFNDPLLQRLPDPLMSRSPQLRALSTAEARQQLWERYCAVPCGQRAELIREALGVSEISLLEIEALTAVFGLHIPHDAYTIPHPQRAAVCAALRAPALMVTGWFDWSLNDALATWELMMKAAPEPVRSTSRLIITPSAHNTAGYHEGRDSHPELQHSHRVPHHVDLLLRWYAAVRESAVEGWPKVIYYLMGANDWCTASAWPPPHARMLKLHLSPAGALALQPMRRNSAPSSYIYDPEHPTPTVGGSIVSSVYAPGSVDVSKVQGREDVLTFTSAPLERPLDVVGPLRLVLYASSSAVDTDFSARLSDVFPDGRAIQLQSGMLRARYRSASGEAEPLEPSRIYAFEIDMWATANRFQAGHRLRLDISSADFPRFDRNTNRGGEPGPPIPATQTVYHDPDRPSHLQMFVIDACEGSDPQETTAWSGQL